MPDAMKTKQEEGAAARGGASPVGQSQWSLLAMLASVRLTLWLLAILVIAIAVATFIPQNEPESQYVGAFGTVLGSFIARTTLHNLYGSWWFITAFGVLAVNLLACSLQRTQQLLRADRAPLPERITRAQVEARAHQVRWRLSQSLDRTAESLRESLERRGWTVALVAGENGSRGLVARRGKLAPWASTIVHVGMVIILIGAAWGRLPRNSYRDLAELRQGESFPVRTDSGSFSLRLNDAGEKRDAKGMPSDYWAKVDVLEEGQVVKSALIKPNQPLRWRSVTAALNSLSEAGWQVEVKKGDAVGDVPVAMGPDGQVDMMATVTRLDDPPWICFIHEFGQDAQGRPQAKVFIDKSGEVSHNWQAVGWVGQDGLDFEGVHFRLVQGGSGATLSLDRDVGIPIVYLGFIVIALGTVLVLGSSRHSLIALVGGKGQGSQVFVGVSRSQSGLGVEKLLAPVQSDLGAARDGESSVEVEEAE